MRLYRKISPQFWIGDTGRKLRDAGPNALLVGLYLLSNPHANMLGLYYLPISFIAHETGLNPKEASEALRRAINAGFCAYDESLEMVFVCEMARYQIADQLMPSDKQCAGIQREYDGLPNSPFLSAFYEKYAEAFHLTKRRKNQSSSEGSLKALRSQEQEQEKNNTSEPQTGSDGANISTHKKLSAHPSQPACTLAGLLKSEILRNKPDYRITAKQVRKWEIIAQRMLELDHRRVEQIEKVIRFVQQDDFERANVLSMDKLRKPFDQLELKAGRSRPKNVAAMPLPPTYLTPSEKILQERSTGGMQ